MELYLQLTEHCNMSCPHCCMNAPRGGKATFMSRKVFDKALEIAQEYGSGITLGGGEPTMHPNFLEWVVDASLACIDASMDMDAPAVLVVTNGKKTETALKLAKLAHLGVVCADLSQDSFHDEIDERVVEEFTRYNKGSRWGERQRGYAGIRNVDGKVLARGRAVENSLSDEDRCACWALFIKPNGDFYQCGCAITKLGNILTDEIPYCCQENPGECEHDVEIDIPRKLVTA